MDTIDFKQLRKDVYEANVGLLKAGLVTMHSGNASGIDRSDGLVVIKPSGIDYETLRPEDLAIVNLTGDRPIPARVPDRICSDLKPSVDTIHHLLLYENDPGIGGVVHTHSNYATAWAAIGEDIPCALTAIADEFGGSIPCVPYVDNEGDHIARAILDNRGKGPAVLLGQHGVFTFDADVKKAFKAAVMVEDVAKTLFFARQMGDLRPFPPEEVEKWYNRYHSTYGQAKVGRRAAAL